MGEAFPISAALARSLTNRPKLSASDVAIMNGYLTGAMPTQPASKQPTSFNILSPHLRRMQRLAGRKWQRSPDRAASMARKRKLGGSSGMPDTIRHHYTEGERAVLTVIAGEVKHHGLCDLAVDRIAAIAGLSRTTVQNAIREARALGHLSVESRPRKGQKNLTNLVRIVSTEWMTWLKRGPSLARQIGFKDFHPTKNQDKNKYKKEYTRGQNRINGARGNRCMGFGEGESGPVAGNNDQRGCGKGSGPTLYGGGCNG